MITTPLHEANDCHVPAGTSDGGQFCSGATGGTLSRGILAQPDKLSRAVADRLIAGKATVEDVLSLISVDSVGRSWWDDDDEEVVGTSAQEWTQADLSPSEALTTNMHRFKTNPDARHYGFIGDIAVALRGRKPKGWEPDEWASAVAPGFIELTQVSYNPGNGWKTLNVTGRKRVRVR